MAPRQDNPRLFAVMGHPIAHSKSPFIHQQFAQQFGFAIDYRAIDVAPGEFAAQVQAFQAEGASGINVTVPYKQEAWALAERHSGRAELAGAVNTLMFADDGSISADNTDGIGLVRDLAINLDTTLFDQRVLVIGAGGAARGILGPLLEQGTRQLVLANRTLSKAEELARVFSTIGSIQACPFHALAGQSFDIVINATAASLEGKLPDVPGSIFRPGALAYDLMYGDSASLFMHWAKEQGAARVADGLGMLVEQAAESFYLWLGKRPDTAAVIALLRQGATD